MAKLPRYQDPAGNWQDAQGFVQLDASGAPIGGTGAAGEQVQPVDASGAPQLGPSGKAPVVGNFAANGNSAAFSPSVGRAVWVTLTGGFGGGTVTVFRSTDGVTWLPLTIGGTAYGVYTAPCQEPVFVEDDAGAQYRLTLTGATAPTIGYRLGHS